VTVVDRLFEHERARPAFTVGGAALDFGALGDRVGAFARGLAARGVAAGDPVALALTTSPELVALVLAAQTLRAIPMIVNPALPGAAIARRAASVGARLVVDEAAAASLPTPGSAPPGRPAPDDLAFLQVTSGTDGEPRAAAVTHRALAAYVEIACRRLAMDARDVLVGWVPLHHDLGLVRFLFTPIYLGAHAHLLPPSIASLGPWLRTLAATRATVTGAPDFAYRLAARTVPADGIDLGALRAATNGGEPVRASSIAAFEGRFGCPGTVLPGYGLAEATLGVSATGPGEALRVDARGHVGCGRPLDGLRVRVAGGPVGELEVAGATLFAGYYTRDGLDRSAFTADGWLRTGDIGHVDAGGVVFVLGRARAMVKQAGALIAPREVEEIVDRVPGVRLSAAIGLPDAQTGTEQLVVVVEAPPPAPAGLAEAVQTAVRAELGAVPASVRLVPPRTIPLTLNGKIRHAALRAQLAAG
jgi:acyl-CoA synthetase (AMP-forming)/AMP-acid ligase II